MNPWKFLDVLAPETQMRGKQEKQNEQASHAHHDAETPEVEWDVGYDVVGRFDESVSIIRHRCSQLFPQAVDSLLLFRRRDARKGGDVLVVVANFEFPVFLEGFHRPAPHGHLLLNARNFHSLVGSVAF